MIQADVMWIKVNGNKFPAMSIVDEGTRFQAASLITSETSDPGEELDCGLWSAGEAYHR